MFCELNKNGFYEFENHVGENFPHLKKFSVEFRLIKQLYH